MNKFNKTDIDLFWKDEKHPELESIEALEYLLPDKEQEVLKYAENLRFDSDDEGKEIIKPSTNPFAMDLSEANDIDQNQDYDQNKEEYLDPNAFLRRVQSYMAVPDYALTDAVFCVDKPRSAVSLSDKLPFMDLAEHCKEDAVFQISVTEVYTPFQFWFQLSIDSSSLSRLTNNLYHLYNEMNRDMENYNYPLPNYFIQPGYICGALHAENNSWRRARILSKPLSAEENVSIYYVDYGSGAEVQRTNLRFLPRYLAVTPPLAIRGCLSYIHPLGPHWSLESVQEFKDVVLGHEIYANVTECDLKESIVFMRLSHNKDVKPSINRLLVDADLAGKSDHYSKRTRELNCGRRLQYLRERLPSFHMLETRVFPIGNVDFEEDFDNLICAPSFYKDYQVPNLKNPFLYNLQKALDEWMVTFKKEETFWRKIYREADKKLKEEFEKTSGGQSIKY